MSFKSKQPPKYLKNTKKVDTSGCRYFRYFRFTMDTLHRTPSKMGEAKTRRLFERHTWTSGGRVTMVIPLLKGTVQILPPTGHYLPPCIKKKFLTPFVSRKFPFAASRKTKKVPQKYKYKLGLPRKGEQVLILCYWANYAHFSQIQKIITNWKVFFTSKLNGNPKWAIYAILYVPKMRPLEMSHALMYLLQSMLVKSRERGKKEAKEKIAKC